MSLQIDNIREGNDNRRERKILDARRREIWKWRQSIKYNNSRGLCERWRSVGFLWWISIYSAWFFFISKRAVNANTGCLGNVCLLCLSRVLIWIRGRARGLFADGFSFCFKIEKVIRGLLWMFRVRKSFLPQIIAVCFKYLFIYIYFTE